MELVSAKNNKLNHRIQIYPKSRAVDFVRTKKTPLWNIHTKGEEKKSGKKVDRVHEEASVHGLGWWGGRRRKMSDEGGAHVQLVPGLVAGVDRLGGLIRHRDRASSSDATTTDPFSIDLSDLNGETELLLLLVASPIGRCLHYVELIREKIYKWRRTIRMGGGR